MCCPPLVVQPPRRRITDPGHTIAGDLCCSVALASYFHPPSISSLTWSSESSVAAVEGILSHGPLNQASLL
ncbi:hypothetical protein SESBI_48704 [Sesbania bispinosa]|nr:hypothetical protein SESBI_48704 [Sesbania bispinosa]